MIEIRAIEPLNSRSLGWNTKAFYAYAPFTEHLEAVSRSNNMLTSHYNVCFKIEMENHYGPQSATTT